MKPGLGTRGGIGAEARLGRSRRRGGVRRDLALWPGWCGAGRVGSAQSAWCMVRGECGSRAWLLWGPEGLFPWARELKRGDSAMFAPSSATGVRSPQAPYAQEQHPPRAAVSQRHHAPRAAYLTGTTGPECGTHRRPRPGRRAPQAPRTPSGVPTEAPHPERCPPRHHAPQVPYARRRRCRVRRTGCTVPVTAPSPATPPRRSRSGGPASSVPGGRASRSGGCVRGSGRAPCRPRSECARARPRCRTAS